MLKYIMKNINGKKRRVKMNIYTFIITSIIIILLPGTGVIYTISNGIIRGKRKAVIAASGCTLGIIPHLLVSVMCSSFIIQSGKIFFMILKILGALYLLYLGYGMIRSRQDLNFPEKIDESQSIQIICRGILINLLNPKLTLFFFAFLPQYLSINTQNYLKESLILGAVFMILTFIVFIVYGVCASFIKDFIGHSAEKMKYIQQFFGIMFILFAAQLALSSL